MDWRSRSCAYNGLIAAPGTPKACVTPSFSITSTAAITALIFAISRLLRPAMRPVVGRHESSGDAADFAVDRRQELDLFSNLDRGQRPPKEAAAIVPSTWRQATNRLM